MSTISSSDPKFQGALHSCVRALRRLAAYRLPDPLDRRLQALGEQKEYLNPAEHQELLALVDFSQQRTRETLEAQVALQRLREFFPDVVDAA